MNTGPVWITTAGFLTTVTELVVTSIPVQASGTNVNYNLISGKLPEGLIVYSTGTIAGIPNTVLKNTDYNFVLRAADSKGISDRSFSITVTGAQFPTWNTSLGYTSILDYNTSTAYLKLGPTGENFTLNKQWVSYQFLATPTNAPNNTKISFYIPENGGQLPPGLHLSKNGILSGFLDDVLTFDSNDEDTGGYDEEAYDGFTYDQGLLEFENIGVPKIYQFLVTASDGVSSSNRFFKILVVSPDMVRDPELIQMKIEPGLIEANPTYLPPPQFINGSDLGEARSENNETFDVSAYNGYLLLGNIKYSIVEGDTRYTQLPDFLNLDIDKGVIYGYIPYQPAYTENYKLTVRATRNYSGDAVTATNTFSLAIKGQVDSSLKWITSSTLGTIYTGRDSELSVIAKQIDSDYSIKYFQLSGSIPEGLTLNRDGSISGNANYGTTGTYSFSIRAQDVYELSAIDRTFTLNVENPDNKKYTKIWVKPFMTLDKRSKFRELMTDSFVFPQASMYRFYDSNFGIQTEIKMFLEFAIEQQNLADYVPALRENFYRKRLYLGDIKLAKAKDSKGSVIYEVVYLDVIDNMLLTNVNANTSESVHRTIYTNNEIYYPSSINNMRYQLEHLTLNDLDFITTDEFNMPLFMRTAQSGNYKPPGYISVLPLCYALPGEGQKIISRIKLSQFNFKQFDLDIDRLIVDKSLDNSSAKYLLFPRQTIGDSINSDQILYVFDETPLETDQNQFINRE